MSDDKTNFFFDNYEELRQTLETLFIYGCYTRKQLQNTIEARGYSYSQRRCDQLLQIIQYYWPDNSTARKNKSRSIPIPVERYQTKENNLWKIYKMKTILEREMNLLFFISCEAAKNKRDIKCIEMNRIIHDKIRIDFATDTGASPIRNASKKMKEWGILDPNKKTTIRAVSNILDKIPENILRQLYELLFFYRETLPLSALGYSLQRVIRDYIVYEKGYDSLPKEGCFVHKDTFLQNILNDEIVFQLLYAIENNKRICFEHDKKDRSERGYVRQFLPLKIISDMEYGRQFVFGEILNEFNPNHHKYSVYRLDKISELRQAKQGGPTSVNNNTDGGGAPCPDLDSILNNMWTASYNSSKRPADVVIDFVFPDEKTAEQLKWRLNAQKRQGIIIQESPTHFTYTIKISDPREMIPWIRSWMPYAHIRHNSNHALAETLSKERQALLDIYNYEAPKPEASAQAENPKFPAAAKDTEDKEKGLDRLPSLFSEFRNIYVSAIHAAMHYMYATHNKSAKGKWRTAEQLKAFIMEYSGIDIKDTCDKYMTAIGEFGGKDKDPKKLCLFKKDEDGFIRPTYPGTPPPIMPGLLEKRYLLTLLNESGTQTVLGKGAVKDIKELLQDIKPFAWEEVLVEHGVYKSEKPNNKNAVWETIRVIMEAIRNGCCLSYKNRDRNNIIHKGILKPYKIMYSPQTLCFQLITAASESPKEEPRLVLMNIEQLLQIKTANGVNLDVDVEELLKQKKQEPLEIVIRPRQDIGFNDIERAFRLFSNYEREAWYDEEKDEYHIKLVYYSFQYQIEILPRILSLGAAAEVLKPESVRMEIINIVKQAETFSAQLKEKTV